jgi:quinol monooxygenase YgiN
MPGDGSSVRDALNHQSLQVSRDDPGPRPMIAVLDARPRVAGRLREKIAKQLAAQVRREPGCLTFTAYEARDVPAASTSTRSTPALPRSPSTCRTTSWWRSARISASSSRLLNGSSASTFATPR